MLNIFDSLASSKKIPLSQRVTRGSFLICGVITVVVLLLLSFLIQYQNQNATKGYKLRLIQEERKETLAHIESLAMKIADQQSIKSTVLIEGDEADKQTFLPVKVVYLESRNTPVAMGKSEKSSL